MAPIDPKDLRAKLKAINTTVDVQLEGKTPPAAPAPAPAKPLPAAPVAAPMPPVAPAPSAGPAGGSSIEPQRDPKKEYNDYLNAQAVARDSMQGLVTFEENDERGYPARTRKNIELSDATISYSVSDSAGEKLTRRLAKEASKTIVELSAFTKTDSQRARELAVITDRFYGQEIVLNIAGNGAYTDGMPDTQTLVDEIAADIEFLRQKGVGVTAVRSGGQTGADEAGIKAAMKLKIKATVLAPKGWTYRDVDGTDISNQLKFKDRFLPTQSEAPAKSLVETDATVAQGTEQGTSKPLAAGSIPASGATDSAPSPVQPMKTDYKSYLEYELVADLSDPQQKDSYQDAEGLPKLSMDYDAGSTGGIGHAQGQTGNNAQKVLDGTRTSTTRPYEYQYKTGDLLAMTVGKKVVAVLRVKANYRLQGTTPDGKAVLLDATSGERVEKPISEMANAEGYDSGGYASKIYKVDLAQSAPRPDIPQGGAQTPPSGETPASVAPMPVSGESMGDPTAPEKMTTASTPVDPVAAIKDKNLEVSNWKMRQDRARAVRAAFSEPITSYDRMYSLLRLMTSGKIDGWDKYKLVDNVTDPVAVNRGRLGVRGLLLHWMLGQLGQSATGQVQAAREEFDAILTDLGFTHEDIQAVRNPKDMAPNYGLMDPKNGDREKKLIAEIDSIINDLQDKGRAGILRHPAYVQSIAYALRETTAINKELVDGRYTKLNFNPVKEESIAPTDSDVVAKIRQDILDKIGGVDPDTKPSSSTVAVDGITLGQLKTYSTTGTRRYAIDKAGLVDPSWQEIDERGLDLNHFVNDYSPAGDSRAAITFHLTTDATSRLGVKRNLYKERQITAALRKYLVGTLGETASGMFGKTEPMQSSLQLESGADNFGENIRFNSTIGYTRDAATVDAEASRIRSMLPREKVVLVQFTNTSGDVKLSDGTVISGLDEFAIFDAGDPRAQEAVKLLRGRASQPFVIGEPVSYFADDGSTADIIFGVDPVVRQSVMHEIPLRTPRGEKYDLAYIPETLVDGSNLKTPDGSKRETRAVVSMNREPSAPGTSEDPIRTHVIADDMGQFPQVGSNVEWKTKVPLTIGNSNNDDPYFYMDENRKDQSGRGGSSGAAPLTDQEYKTGLDLIKRMEDETAAGVPKRDAIKLTSEEEDIVGRVRERSTEVGGYSSLEMTKLPPAAPAELSKNPYIAKILANLNMDEIHAATPEARNQTLVALIADVVRGKGVFDSTSDFASMVQSGAIAEHKQKKAAASMGIGEYTTDVRGNPIQRTPRTSVTGVPGNKKFIEWLYSEDGIRTVVALRADLSSSGTDVVQEIEKAIPMTQDVTPVEPAGTGRFTGVRTPAFSPYSSEDVYESTPSHMTDLENKKYADKVAEIDSRYGEKPIPVSSENIPFDEPTADEVIKIRKIQRALLFVLTRRATKAFWFGTASDGPIDNTNLHDIPETAQYFDSLLGELDGDVKLGNAEADSALKAFADRTGYIIPEEEVVKELKTQMPIDETGQVFKGLGVMQLSESEKKSPVNRAAQSIYEEFVKEAAKLRLRGRDISISTIEKAGQQIEDTGDGTEAKGTIAGPQSDAEKTFIEMIASNGSAPGVSNKEMALVDKAIESVPDLKLRALLKEIRIRGTNVSDIRSAAYPPAFSDAMQRVSGIKATRGVVSGAVDPIDQARQAAWEKYVDENYAFTVERLKKVISVTFADKIESIKASTGADVVSNIAVDKLPKFADTVAKATAGLTLAEKKSAIERAYYRISQHHAMDGDGDGWIKMINNLLHQDDLQKTITAAFNEVKFMDITDLLVKSTGEVYVPSKIGKYKSRLLTDAEVRMAFTDNGYAEARSVKEMIDANKLDVYVEYNQNPQPGQREYTIIVAKVIKAKDGKRVIGIDDKFSVRGSYQPGDNLGNTDDKVQYIRERLKANGADRLFDIQVSPLGDQAPTTGVAEPVRLVVRPGAFTEVPSGDGRFWFDLATRGDTKSTAAKSKIFVDAFTRHDYINRVHDALVRAGFESPYTQEDLSLESSIKRTFDIYKNPETASRLGVAGPFHARLTASINNELRLFKRPASGAGEPLLPNLLEKMGVSAEGQKPGVDLMLDSMLAAGETGPQLAQEVNRPWRPTGNDGRLLLSPSEQSLYQRYRSMSRSAKIATILGGGTGGILLGLAQNAIQNKVMYGDQADSITKQQLPIATAFEVLAAADPRVAAVGQLAFTGLNHGDMLRAVINMAAAFGGGAVAGLAGSKFGPLGSLAGSYLGSTAASMATDSIYGAVAGNKSPEYKYAPSDVAMQTPTTLGAPNQVQREQDIIDKLGG